MTKVEELREHVRGDLLGDVDALIAAVEQRERERIQNASIGQAAAVPPYEINWQENRVLKQGMYDLVPHDVLWYPAEKVSA